MKALNPNPKQLLTIISMALVMYCHGQRPLTPGELYFQDRQRQYEEYWRQRAYEQEQRSKALETEKAWEAEQEKRRRASTPEVPSAESVKAYQEAYDSFQEKKRQAAFCVCNVAPYSEVRFLMNFPSYSDMRDKTITQQYLEGAKQLNNVWLLTGYLLTIKIRGSYAVAVRSQQPGTWNIYVVYNYSNSSAEKFNMGELELGDVYYAEASGTGLTDQLKQVERKSIQEMDRISSERKMKSEKEEEQRNRYAEEAKQRELSGWRNIKELRPYQHFYLGEFLGAKLDIKGYTLAPSESFVAFFYTFVTEGLRNTSKSPITGAVYKVVFDQSGKPRADLFELYYSQVPDTYKPYFWYDPFRYQFFENLVAQRLKLITDYEYTIVKNFEYAYFNAVVKKMNDESAKAAESRDQFVLEYRELTSRNTRYGEYLGGMTDMSFEFEHGLGIRDFKSFQQTGTFSENKVQEYVEDATSGSVSVYYKNSRDEIDLLRINGDGGVIQSSEQVSFLQNGDVLVMDYRHVGWKLSSSGELYSGEFRDSLYEGKGTLIMTNGKGYVGEFEKGQLIKKSYKLECGKINKPGGIYTGEIVYGKPSGRGLLKFKNGNELQGFFIGGDRFEGIYRTKDGKTFYGSFRYDFSETEKVLVEKDYLSYLIHYSNGDIYRGSVNESLGRTGGAACIYKTGEIYIGAFTNDKRNDPEGLLIYKKGEGAANYRDICQAPFVDNKIDGKGEYLDGTRKEKYVGNFKNGLRDGEGAIYYADGISKSVMYVLGVLQQ